MPDTTAQILRKGCETTGIDEDMAARMIHRVGGRVMAIVELQIKKPHGPDLEGKRSIDLIINQINPVPLDDETGLDERLRNVARTLDYNRRVATGDEPTLDGTEPEPIANVMQHLDPFVQPEALDLGDDGSGDGED
ncbi:hypothetical protein [Nocardioides alkalitolerans]|uniref:hypothetical protein n=1 Tax=Nocardioides alkalitolerans TaxID=281714 RepID=UPI000417462B|nr:hypothetical protein [Nocardioides alkalitolerans]